MIYNIHPLVVHFPIALLCCYSLLKILPVQSWFPKTSWVSIERFLLSVGTFGILLATSSGDTAKHMVRPDRDLVHTHEFFANLTLWFYMALVIIELLPVIISFTRDKKILSEKILYPITRLLPIITKQWIIRILALLGFLALFLTGLLGGVITHGAATDPIAPFVLNMLGL